MVRRWQEIKLRADTKPRVDLHRKDINGTHVFIRKHSGVSVSYVYKGKLITRSQPPYHCYVEKRLVGRKFTLGEAKALLEGELLNVSAKAGSPKSFSPALSTTPVSS